MLQCLSLVLLLVKSRMENQYGKLCQSFPWIRKWSRVHFFILIQLLTLIPLAFVVCALLNMVYQPEMQAAAEICLILVFIAFHIISGMAVYRRTHFPAHLHLLAASPRDKRFIYITLLLEQWLWLVCTNPGLYLVTFILFTAIRPELAVACIFLYVLYGLIGSFLIFLISNLIYGLYMAHKITRPIGIIRFLGYLASSAMFVALGCFMVKGIAPFITILRTHFTNWEQVADNQAWDNLFPVLQNQAFTMLSEVGVKLTSEDGLPVMATRLFHPVSLLSWLILSALSSVLLLFLKQLIPDMRMTREKVNHQSNRDFLVLYCELLVHINRRLMRRNMFVWKDLQHMQASRRFVSPSFFSLVFLSSESFFYFGIFLALVPMVMNDSYAAVLTLTFSILAMVNQAYELREEFPLLFLMSAEGRQINLIRMAGVSIIHLYKAKLQLMRTVMVIPLLLVLAMGLWLLQHGSLALFGLLWVLGLAYWAAPLFQLYISPYISKFGYQDEQDVGQTHEETAVYQRFQSIPRKFVVVPLLVVLYLSMFLHLPQAVINMLPYIYSVYFTIAVLVFERIAYRISNRGAAKLEYDRGG